MAEAQGAGDARAGDRGMDAGQGQRVGVAGRTLAGGRGREGWVRVRRQSGNRLLLEAAEGVAEAARRRRAADLAGAGRSAAARRALGRAAPGRASALHRMDARREAAPSGVPGPSCGQEAGGVHPRKAGAGAGGAEAKDRRSEKGPASCGATRAEADESRPPALPEGPDHEGGRGRVLRSGLSGAAGGCRGPSADARPLEPGHRESELVPAGRRRDGRRLDAHRRDSRAYEERGGPPFRRGQPTRAALAGAEFRARDPRLAFPRAEPDPAGLGRVRPRSGGTGDDRAGGRGCAGLARNVRAAWTSEHPQDHRKARAAHLRPPGEGAYLRRRRVVRAAGGGYGGEAAEERHPRAVPRRAARTALLRLHAERVRQDGGGGVLLARSGGRGRLHTAALERGQAGPRSEAVQSEDDAVASAGNGRLVRARADARPATPPLQAVICTKVDVSGWRVTLTA